MEHAKKTQTSFEFIVIISIFLLIFLVLGGINLDILSRQDNQARTVKAKDTINELYKATELVYREGKLSRTKVFVNIPSSVESTATGNKLVMNLSVDGETISVFRTLPFEVQGDIPTASGYYWINITSYGSYVEISY